MGRHVLQVVQVGAIDRQPLDFFLCNRPPRAQGVLHGMQQIPPGLRLCSVLHIGNRALRHQTPTTFPGAGANINDVVGRADRVLVMLYDH